MQEKRKEAGGKVAVPAFGFADRSRKCFNCAHCVDQGSGMKWCEQHWRDVREYEDDGYVCPCHRRK